MLNIAYSIILLLMVVGFATSFLKKRPSNFNEYKKGSIKTASILGFLGAGSSFLGQIGNVGGMLGFGGGGGTTGLSSTVKAGVVAAVKAGNWDSKRAGIVSAASKLGISATQIDQWAVEAGYGVSSGGGSNGSGGSGGGNPNNKWLGNSWLDKNWKWLTGVVAAVITLLILMVTGVFKIGKKNRKKY